MAATSRSGGKAVRAASPMVPDSQNNRASALPVTRAKTTQSVGPGVLGWAATVSLSVPPAGMTRGKAVTCRQSHEVETPSTTSGVVASLCQVNSWLKLWVTLAVPKLWHATSTPRELFRGGDPGKLSATSASALRNNTQGNQRSAEHARKAFKYR